MDEFDRRVFAELLNAVVMKCFGHSLNTSLSEPESKHLSTEIEESTGLVIGWRSVKNYAAFLLNPSSGKQENPSVATLDTLARYVLDAPVTSEAERKKTEEHFPYWFRYREQAGLIPKPVTSSRKPQKGHWVAGIAVFMLLAVISGFLFFRQSSVEQIQEDFHTSNEAYLAENGWFVQDKNAQFWNRRAEKPGHLTLFTLKGDNWPKTGEHQGVQNLLLREIQNDCFRTEVHFTDFVPSGNWQQAGLLLLEDTLFTGKSVRLSLAYNNYFGGYNKPGEILIQAIASNGKADRNLEEFIHQPLLQLGNADERRIAATNLKNVAFRIEKQGNKFRFLYSASPVDNFSFKEISTYEFGISPKYIGVFALKGFVDTTAVMPVSVRYFRLDAQRCE
ncbi:hypothetical protein GO730_16425 [Spirosoma sp. HMF3257]|uniref:Beta-xylosidase C-terminal Concanavalin A-like domain-containing protein n=1 Tax=Spirosoma telluris TaxID=2183553 RepID=A0A327NIY6_9BACT|nr:hypothetical protein [Spirosoma telluris]RAI75361.1 hypothetical protein HMF3257_16365 [Spirosoma telluris]